MVVKWVPEFFDIGTDMLTILGDSHFSPYMFTRTLLPILTKTSRELGSDVRVITVRN